MLSSRESHLGVVQALITAGADVHALDECGQNALSYASCSEHTEVIEQLVLAGADVKAEDDAGATPLDRVPAARERHKGNVEQEERLNAVVANLSEADLLKQIERQTTEGVTVEEGQRVRDWFQYQIGGNVVSEGGVCVKAQ